jgi:hypothetical protein
VDMHQMMDNGVDMPVRQIGRARRRSRPIATPILAAIIEVRAPGYLCLAKSLPTIRDACSQAFAALGFQLCPHCRRISASVRKLSKSSA